MSQALSTRPIPQPAIGKMGQKKPCRSGHCPDGHGEPVDQAIDQQMHPEVAPLLQPPDRLVPERGTICHIVGCHRRHLLAIDASRRAVIYAEPIVPPREAFGHEGRRPAASTKAGIWPPPSTTRFAPLI